MFLYDENFALILLSLETVLLYMYVQVFQR